MITQQGTRTEMRKKQENKKIRLVTISLIVAVIIVAYYVFNYDPAKEAINLLSII